MFEIRQKQIILLPYFLFGNTLSISVSSSLFFQEDLQHRHCKLSYLNQQ